MVSYHLTSIFVFVVVLLSACGTQPETAASVPTATFTPTPRPTETATPTEPQLPSSVLTRKDFKTIQDGLINAELMEPYKIVIDKFPESRGNKLYFTEQGTFVIINKNTGFNAAGQVEQTPYGIHIPIVTADAYQLMLQRSLVPENLNYRLSLVNNSPETNLSPQELKDRLSFLIDLEKRQRGMAGILLVEAELAAEDMRILSTFIDIYEGGKISSNSVISGNTDLAKYQPNTKRNIMTILGRFNQSHYIAESLKEGLLTDDSFNTFNARHASELVKDTDGTYILADAYDSYYDVRKDPKFYIDMWFYVSNYGDQKFGLYNVMMFNIQNHTTDKNYDVFQAPGPQIDESGFQGIFDAFHEQVSKPQFKFKIEEISLDSFS